MVLPIAMLNDAANLELRAKVCLDSSADIFIPGTYGSSDCFESLAGLALAFSENELTFMLQRQGQSRYRN